MTKTRATCHSGWPGAETVTVTVTGRHNRGWQLGNSKPARPGPAGGELLTALEVPGRGKFARRRLGVRRASALRPQAASGALAAGNECIAHG